jgi:hypothetical protein
LRWGRETEAQIITKKLVPENRSLAIKHFSTYSFRCKIQVQGSQRNHAKSGQVGSPIVTALSRFLRRRRISTGIGYRIAFELRGNSFSCLANPTEEPNRWSRIFSALGTARGLL